MKQFYFYDSYAKLIDKLTHDEAGQLLKMLCGYMFGEKTPNEKTLPKARALFYLLYEQLTDEKSKENAAAKRNTKHFFFPSSYSQVHKNIRRCGSRAFDKAIL